MSIGLCEQIVRGPEIDYKKSYQLKTASSRKAQKRLKHKAERQRVRMDINCFSYYGRYDGWEY